MPDSLLKGRINLDRAVVLLLDDSRESMSVLVQILSGFGVKSLHRCRTEAAARQIVLGHEVDLVIADANGEGSDSYEFVRWLRRSRMQPNAMAPVILVSGHSKLSNVQRARDCGADFIVAKPLSPTVLLERIVWVAREQRSYIDCETYTGPDRRFHDQGPPEGMAGRRQDDDATGDPLADLSNVGRPKLSRSAAR